MKFNDTLGVAFLNNKFKSKNYEGPLSTFVVRVDKKTRDIAFKLNDGDMIIVKPSTKHDKNGNPYYFLEVLPKKVDDEEI